jgi:ABC-type amino acid transport substrate-binding protein
LQLIVKHSPAASARKPVNEALLKLKENGTYELLYAKWFGATGS